MSQNSADEDSPLDCDPECPQEEYVYDYQYADTGHKEETKTHNNPVKVYWFKNIGL